ncbi:TFIIB-type zinc ribbon-containing protein [Enterococcus sp. 2201sp1_2201st1_B8_2201SCRN_220225]|uniref:TFIIB-type zinc ribbon-containing protein n=1 Tax=unclassified Enterococcus TaxID=2608891 RepID=UPI0034A59702
MEVITHKCPNCGGALTFDPADQKFHCPYCLSIFTEAEVSEFEAKQKAAQMVDEDNSTATGTTEDAASKDTTTETETSAEGTMELYLCPSCGAEIVTDTTTAATFCYYCHNPVVLQGRLSGKFLPDKVLPFAITKEEAVESFLNWSQKKWFVPKDFFNKDQVAKLTGVYFPYWNVNAQADGGLNGTGTSLRVWIVGDIEYTETKQYEVRRAGRFRFSNLVKNALSKNTQQKMVESVQPFQLEQAVNFKDQYLAGFQAEKRDIEYQTLASDVEQELKGYGENLLKNTVGSFTTFSVQSSHLELTDTKKEYLLLPVWLVTYQADDDRKKTFYYAMNGQTGKVAGILPISYKKLGLVAGGIFAGLLALFMGVAYLL